MTDARLTENAHNRSDCRKYKKNILKSISPADQSVVDVILTKTTGGTDAKLNVTPGEGPRLK